MISVPVVSMKGISSVTITFPSMIISSEPVGMPLLQLFRSDHTPVEPPTQPFATVKETVSISALRPSSGPSSWNPKTVELDDAVTGISKCAQSVVSASLVLALNVPMTAPSQCTRTPGSGFTSFRSLRSNESVYCWPGTVVIVC